MQTIKCVLVGDGDVGVQALVRTYKTILFPSASPYTLLEDVITVTVKEEPYYLLLVDTTSNGEDYARLRPLSYPQTDVFLICFSVVSPTSFESIKETFVPEITRYCPKKAPFLLVGTKINLRADAATIENLSKNKQKPISVESAEKLARELRAIKYLECSVTTQQGVKNVFDEAIMVALEPIKKKCILL